MTSCWHAPGANRPSTAPRNARRGTGWAGTSNSALQQGLGAPRRHDAGACPEHENHQIVEGRCHIREYGSLRARILMSTLVLTYLSVSCGINNRMHVTFLWTPECCCPSQRAALCLKPVVTICRSERVRCAFAQHSGTVKLPVKIRTCVLARYTYMESKQVGNCMYIALWASGLLKTWYRSKL